MIKFKYLFYHTKALLKKRSTWALLISIVLFVMIILGINTPDALNTRLGIITNDSTYAKKIIANIKNGDGVYEIIEYDNQDALKEDVLSGKIECGFIFSDKFDKKAREGRMKDTIEYIFSPYTTKGLVAKETLYASFLKYYSEVILMDNYEKIYGEYDEEKADYLLKQNSEYQDSQDIFTVDFHNDI